MSDRIHREVLNKHKLTMLQLAAKKVIDSGNTIIDIKMFRDNINNHNNWQKLRYHGLIWHYTQNNEIKRGKWIITRNGWAFLRGELSLPKFVLIQNNAIVQRSTKLISVKDVYYGAEEVIGMFQYYDDNGRYVGTKPGIPESKQVAML